MYRVVMFENEELARQNSDRPETNEYYREFLSFIEGEPEFIDAEAIHHYLL